MTSVVASLPAPSSLVPRERNGAAATAPRRWVVRRASDPNDGVHCPRFPFDYLDLESGALRPGSCKSLRCDICGGFEVKRRAWKAARAGPERFLTLTLLPADFQPARKAEAKFLRYVRKAGYSLEWCIAHELTKSGLRHAHALCKGDRIPQALVSQWAERSGMGRVADIRRIRGDGATYYALKESLRTVRYATKGAEHLDEHLALNGGRLYRATRGYWK